MSKMMEDLSYEASHRTQTSDRLVDRYSAVADDGKKSEKQREAAMLLSVAEGQLDDNGNPDQALSSANQALTLFKQAADRMGAADTLRLIIRANVEKADLLKWDDEESPEARETLKRTERMAKQELDLARENSDKRAQGAMLLSLAQMNFNRRGSKKREDALDCALKAAPIFKQIGDAKFEAMTHLTLARIYYKKHNVQASIKSANEAIAMFQSIGDKIGEGEACHTVGSANVQGYKVAEGLEFSAKAASLYQEAGNLKMYAREQHALADWNLKRNDVVSGLAAAKEAYRTFKGLRYGKGWEGSSLSMMVECLVGMQKVNSALKEARAAVKDFKARGELKEQCRCMQSLVSAMAADNDHDEAEAVVEEGIEISKRLGDRHLEIEMRKLGSQLALSAQKFPTALRHAEAVKELYKDLGASKQEALELMHSITKVNYMADDKKRTKESADQAINLAEQLGDKNVQAYAMLASSAAYLMNDDAEQALKAAREAVELFNEDGDKMGEARSMLQVSEIQRSQGDFKAALASAEDSLDLRAELGDGQKQAAVMIHMADIHIQIEKFKDARDLCQEGVRLAKENGDDKTTAKLMSKMSEAYFGMLEKEDPNSRVMKELIEKAVKTGREACRVAGQSQDMRLEASAQYWLASLYLLAGKYGDMIQAANDAISLYKQSGEMSGQVNAMCLIGKAFLQQGRDSRATTVVEDAQVLAKKIGDTAGEQRASDLLKEISSRKTVAAPTMMMAAAAPTAAAAAGPAASAAPADGAVSAYNAPDIEVVKGRIVALVNDLSGEDSLDADTPFMDAGVDSLASVELRTNLQKAFGVQLPSTVMFNYPTTSSIADFLITEMTENQVSLS
jgi:tetratricopeptide (TPR) repeat protein/acyl carrier protein